jgi:hypothetical protein
MSDIYKIIVSFSNQECWQDFCTCYKLVMLIRLLYLLLAKNINKIFVSITNK